jgi:hypothetical protein
LILKDIYFQVDPVEYIDRDDDRLYARDKSRHICNYLGRNLRKLKFEVNGYNRIVFTGFKNPDDPGNYPDNKFGVNSANALIAPVKFDLDEFKRLGAAEIGDFFYSLLTDELKTVAKLEDIPLHAILDDLDLLKRNNYINCWLFKTKSFTSKKIKCSLVCSMDQDNFHLKLVIESKSKIIFDKKILTTPPDEISYHRRFSDIELRDNEIFVLDYFKEPIFKTTLPAASP